jgi:transcriptional regulator GlxA family with amidase domain
MNVNIVLYDDFELMDAFGPAQIFGTAPEHFYLNYLSANGGIVTSSQGVKIWTEILIPEEIMDILVIPGGKGARRLLCLENDWMKLIQKSAKEADLCMMVGNGSALLAQTGLLYRRKIADYDYDENWKRMFTAGMTRIPNLSWMSDGKYYSCSSTAASLDMTLGVVADVVDLDVALQIAKKLGYAWNMEHDGILV